jgi:hypothetical protein
MPGCEGRGCVLSALKENFRASAVASFVYLRVLGGKWFRQLTCHHLRARRTFLVLAFFP